MRQIAGSTNRGGHTWGDGGAISPGKVGATLHPFVYSIVGWTERGRVNRSPYLWLTSHSKWWISTLRKKIVTYDRSGPKADWKTWFIDKLVVLKLTAKKNFGQRMFFFSQWKCARQETHHKCAKVQFYPMMMDKVVNNTFYRKLNVLSGTLIEVANY